MTADQREPVSILVPTIEWTESCDDLVDNLRDDDELLVICDTESDPVMNHQPPDQVRLVVAGEPEGCSGKSNAMAYGMELASNDRFVWTDADFRRDDEWVDRLIAESVEANAPATAIPFFYGSGWWRIWEPWTVIFSTLLFYLNVGSWGGNAWGGGVTFTRDDVDVEVLVEELRQSLSDDGLLSSHLEYTHPVRSMVTPVRVPGNLRSVIHRQIRFNRLTHVREGMYDAVIVGLGLLACAVAFPLYTSIAVTVLAATAYLICGIRRWTFVFAFPGIFTVLLGGISGITKAEFEWAGRRYRLNAPKDVEIVDS